MSVGGFYVFPYPNFLSVQTVKMSRTNWLHSGGRQLETRQVGAYLRTTGMIGHLNCTFWGQFSGMFLVTAYVSAEADFRDSSLLQRQYI